MHKAAQSPSSSPLRKKHEVSHGDNNSEDEDVEMKDMEIEAGDFKKSLLENLLGILKQLLSS